MIGPESLTPSMVKDLPSGSICSMYLEEPELKPIENDERFEYKRHKVHIMDNRSPVSPPPIVNEESTQEFVLPKRINLKFGLPLTSDLKANTVKLKLGKKNSVELKRDICANNIVKQLEMMDKSERAFNQKAVFDKNQNTIIKISMTPKTVSKKGIMSPKPYKQNKTKIKKVKVGADGGGGGGTVKKFSIKAPATNIYNNNPETINIQVKYTTNINKMMPKMKKSKKIAKSLTRKLIVSIIIIQLGIKECLIYFE